MPLFAYKCNSCQHVVEKLQKEAKVPSKCPSCHVKGVMEKQFSAPGFILKGTGYYQTDFKGKK
jgi:putative FmdB family regulatory protein